MSLSLGLGIVANFAASFTPLEASMSAEENLYTSERRLFFLDVNGKHSPPFLSSKSADISMHRI